MLLRVNRNVGLQHFPQLETTQMIETYDVAAASICHGLKGLSQGQGKLCQLSVDHMPIVARGAKFGILECQHQFRDRRWNCSTVHDESVFGPMLRLGKLPLKILLLRQFHCITCPNRSQIILYSLFFSLLLIDALLVTGNPMLA